MSIMLRSYDVGRYIQTVRDNDEFFRNYYFHSIIDLNLIKLDNILKHGILSRTEIEKLKLISYYMHSIRSYECSNGSENISLVDYDRLFNLDDKDEPSFNQMFEAFALHTLTSLSLLVDRNINVSIRGVRESGFDDEVYALRKIEKEHIKGILFPNHLKDEKIKNISFLSGDHFCYKEKNINHLVDCLENYFSKKIDREPLLISLSQAWSIADELESASITSAIRIQKERYGTDMRDELAILMHKLWEEKSKIENPTYYDIIKYLNNDNLPIYEIGTKKLIKH